MPPPAFQEYSITLIVIACVAVAILVLMLIVLLRINGRLAKLSSNVSRSNRLSKTDEAEPLAIGPGTPFDEFLREDSARLALTKKEQFKAYRAWRSEKGLNWPTKD